MPRFTLRVLTIFDGLIFALFEADFPFRFPCAVRESGKRKWASGDARLKRRAYDLEIKGW
jgi:hypothetical protein